MNRIEHIGDATLYLGDCREIMPTLDHVGAIITDPVWPNCPPDTIPGSDDPWRLWQEACARMPSCDRVVVCMRADSDPRFLQYLPALQFFRSIQLPYVIPGYIGRKLGGDETAYWFGSPIKHAPGRTLIPGRAPAAQPNKRFCHGHPMTRAQVHFDWLVDWCSDISETVLDPFMGSGTTGVACASLGRPFIGIEIDERYFDLACERVELASRQSDLVIIAERGAA